MQEQLQLAIAPYRDAVDYVEIRVEQSEQTAISFRGEQLDAVDRSLSLAGGIRACHQGGWSFVTFNGLAELQDRIEAAISQARLVGKDTTSLAPLEPIQDYVAVELGRDPRGLSLLEKRQLIAEYNRLLLEYDPRIQTTMVGYRDRFGITYFVNSTGSCIVQERLDISARFGAIARGDEGIVRQGFESVHSRSDYDALVGYMIRNGKIAEPVSDVTLTGNVFQTLKDIDAIGNDTLYVSGGCGKGGQMPLAVSVGGPHVRIKDVVVGGR